MVESIRIEHDGKLWRIHYAPSGYVFATSDPDQVRKAVELLLAGDEIAPVLCHSEDDKTQQTATEDAVETRRYPVGLRGRTSAQLETNYDNEIRQLDKRVRRLENYINASARAYMIGGGRYV